jgi:hypothetical protein
LYPFVHLSSGPGFAADDGNNKTVTDYSELTLSFNFILHKDRQNATVNKRKWIWNDVYHL